MKFRLIAILISLSFCAVSGAAQTNTFPASGNVGIGTTSPTDELNLSTPNNTYLGIASPQTGQSIVKFYQDPSLYFEIGKDGNWDQNAFILYDATATGSPALIFRTVPGSNVFSLYPWGGGNVGIGTTGPQYTLDVAGTIHATGAINAAGGVTFPDGTSQTTAFNSTLCGGDYAESVDIDRSRATYEPGDVLVISPDEKTDVTQSSEEYSTRVGGIYSTKPGAIGRRQITSNRSNEIPMAMVGIVPTKVSAENGPIHKGDLLVTASLKGYAMKGTDRSRMLGAVIGKAMGSLESGKGVIEVLVTLQ